MFTLVLIDFSLNQICLIAYNYNLCDRVGIVLDLAKPAFDTIESWGCIKIVHQNNANRVFVICSRYCSEWLLTGLRFYDKSTVSQICSLMILFFTLIFLVANSTPIVGLFTSLNWRLMYMCNKALLPTDASPTKMYLKT